MIIKGILTKRKHVVEPSWDLVYEWEDTISSVLGCRLLNYSELADNRLIRRIPYLTNFLLPKDFMLVFEMNTMRWRGKVNNKSNIIPIVIDFYLKENELNLFYSSFINNPIVFVTSREVFEFLRMNNCPLSIEHLPLSLPDKYFLPPDASFNKKYDLVMVGRQNRILLSFVERYSKEHPEFYYVYRTVKDKKFCYLTSRGENLGEITTREEYFNLLKQSKVGLYSTPGMDGGESRTNGFNQVTPRFLELIASGCHILARYPRNPDTIFYELDKFCTCINTYEQFCNLISKKIKQAPDLRMYSDYLLNHYTSVRANKLKLLIKNI